MIDYIFANLWLLWTIIALICLIIELGSGDFFVICFAFGAAATIVLSLLGTPFWLQVLGFAVFSVLSILFIRPPLVRLLHAKDTERPSNADALLGREGTVIEAIPEDGSGYVKIDGDAWRAVSKDGEAIKKDSRVKVVDRQSIIITVIPI